MTPLIGLGVGLVGSIGKAIGRGKANRQMERLLGQDPTYKENPLAAQRLGLAQALLNARMPGAATAERNIYTGAANTMAGYQRAATDASQLLAGGADVQGRTNDAFSDLGQAEAQDYQRRYSNLGMAQEGVINEQQKVFEDNVRRFQNQVSIRGAQNENRQNTWGDISNFGFSLANMAAQNPNLFRSGGGDNYQSFSGRNWGNIMQTNLPQNSQFQVPSTRPTPRPPQF